MMYFPAANFRTPSPNCPAGAPALGWDDSVIMFPEFR